MAEVIRKYWDKTQGYKTASAGVLLLIFQLVKLIWNQTITPQWEEWILNAISIVGATGVLDKLWRSRKEFIEWIKHIFTKEK